jgi:hypothetical protein
MSYCQWRRRRSLQLRRWCCPRRHSPRWGLPSSWRCPWRWQLVSLAKRCERNAGTLAWMAGWRCCGQYPTGGSSGGPTSEAARLWETLPMASQMLGPYENPIKWKFNSWMSMNLNSKLKIEENYTCDPSKHGVERSPGALGHVPYGERPTNCMSYVNHLLSNWIRPIEHIRNSYVQYS